MKNQYCIPLLSIVLILALLAQTSFTAQAQDKFSFISSSLSIKEGAKIKGTNSSIGGLNTPQFGSMDLDNDGTLDLIIFDGIQSKYYTFINNGQATNNFVYTPYFENSLPPFQSVMIVRDFDRDGKIDIMGGNNVQDLIIYKNITTSTDKTPKFKKLYNHYYLNLYFGNDVFNPLTSRNSDYPIIGDMDLDGDLDFVKYEAGIGTIGFYVNKEIEQSYTGGDSLLLEYSDICWGSFTENATENKINVGACGSNKKYRHLGGSALLQYDFDNDGDVDIIMSNSTFNDVVYIENGKSDYSYQYDTAISSTTNFPPSSPIDITSYPHLFMLDVNNDGKLDLVAAPGGTENYKDLNQINLYLNSGTNALPVFDSPNKNYLSDEILDLGSNSSPALWDEDNDGDLDLFIAASGDFTSTSHTADRIFFYKNNNGTFELTNSDYANLSGKGYLDLSITFGDVNFDNRPDLVYGLRDGSVGWYENTGSIGAPTFTERSILVEKTSKTASAVPFLYDYTKDGKPDLFVGYFKGNISYYYNNGNNTFTLLADTFGQVSTNYIDSNFNPPSLSYEGYAAPVIMDINNDNYPELITGTVNGKIKIFSIDKSDPKAKFEELEHPILTAFNADTTNYNNIGYNVIPALGDLDGDNTIDIVAGSRTGGIMFFSGLASNNKMTKGIESIELGKNHFTIYPNPAENIVNIKRNDWSETVSIQLYDVLGKLLIETKSSENSLTTQINISSLTNGTYYIKCLGKNGESIQTSKLVILNN